MDTYTVVSAFSGAGGLDLAVRAAIPTRTICYIEREITCARVLAERASEGLLDEAPIYSDVKTFPTELFAGKVDILIGGFPCQPFSVAGKQEGSEDERNLWPDTLRLIRSLRPRYAFMENVPGLVSHEYFGTILGDLAEAGYDAEWGSFTASEIGASHRRERVFILAHAKRDGIQEPRSANISPKGYATTPLISSSKELAHAEDTGTFSRDRSNECVCGCRVSATENEGQEDETRGDIRDHSINSSSSKALAHANRQSVQGRDISTHSPGKWSIGEASTELGELPEFPPGPGDPRWEWIIEHYPELAPALCKMHETEPEVRNVDDAWAIKDRVAALMMLGNAVVPQQAEHAFRTLLARIEP